MEQSGAGRSKRTRRSLDRMRAVFRISICIGAAALIAVAGSARAGACDEARNGLTMVHFNTGETDIPRSFLAKLDRFASVAKYKHSVCVKGIVDPQGGAHALNRQIARSRALNIKLYLTSRGVPERAIEIETQDQSFTLFGTLDPNQPANRRVRLTHD